jgi:hypothetical protein
LSGRPFGRAGFSALATNAAEVRDMAILAVIGVLTLFSLLSFELGTDDWRQAGYTPLDDGMFWMRLGSR